MVNTLVYYKTYKVLNSSKERMPIIFKEFRDVSFDMVNDMELEENGSVNFIHARLVQISIKKCVYIDNRAWSVNEQ